MSGFGFVITDAFMEPARKLLADEFATVMVGHPIWDKDFDQAEWDRQRAWFMETFDTNEKLAKYAEGLAAEDGP